MNAILFDLDGTLLDTAPDFALALVQLAKQYELPFTSEPTALHARLRTIISDGSAAILDAYFADFLAAHPNQKAAFKRDFLTHYHSCLGQGTAPFPGIVALLEAIQANGLPWGIVTNKATLHTMALLEKLRTFPTTNTVICGDTLPVRKPDPAPVHLAAKQLGCAAEHCVMVGDALRDLQAGQDAGAKTILALFGYLDDHTVAREWPCDASVEQAHEIWPILSDWTNI